MVLLAEFGLAGLQPGRLWWKRSDTTGGPRTCLRPATLGQVAPATRRRTIVAASKVEGCSHPLQLAGPVTAGYLDVAEAVQVDRVEPAKARRPRPLRRGGRGRLRFERVYQLDERRDGSFRMFAEVPSGRRIWVIWRYDREDQQVPDVFGEVDGASVFVITAY